MAVESSPFQSWMHEHPEFCATHIIPENDRWGRVVCKWKEKREDKELNHVFMASIDLKTGDVYLDCRKRKLFAKNVTLFFARPIFALSKTIYHLSLAGVIRQIYLASTGEQTKAEAFKHSVRQFADIVRTPYFSTALMIINLAAVAITPIAPNKLYDLRELHGRIEQQLNWGETHTNWTLAVCFQSGFNVMGKDYRSTREDTIYSKKLDDKIEASTGVEKEKLIQERRLEKRLTNFARALIRHRQNTAFNPFYQLGKLDPNIPFKSRRMQDLAESDQKVLLRNAQILLKNAEKRLKQKIVEDPGQEDVQTAINNLTHAIEKLEKKGKDNHRVTEIAEKAKVVKKLLAEPGQ